MAVFNFNFQTNEGNSISITTDKTEDEVKEIASSIAKAENQTIKEEEPVISQPKL